MFIIKEWNLLRVCACISIVFLHTTTWINFMGPPIDNEALLFMRVLLCFATPTFIMLSIIILANKYPTHLPKGFWQSRIKFLLLPFLVWATLDAWIRGLYSSSRTFSDYIWNNIFYGGFVGWFVLVILQLYFIYMLVTKWPWLRFILLPVGIIISVIHLNELFLPEHFYMAYEKILHISFTPWMIYFAVAYIVGRYYRQITPILLKLRYVLLIVTAVSGYYVYIHFLGGDTLPESRRFDLLPFVIAITLLILAWGQRIPTFKLTQLISQYAFAIYLIHWQVLFFFTQYVIDWTGHFALQVGILFFVALIGSILIATLFNYIPFGSFIVGKIKKRPVPIHVPKQKDASE